MCLMLMGTKITIIVSGGKIDLGELQATMVSLGFDIDRNLIEDLLVKGDSGDKDR